MTKPDSSDAQIIEPELSPGKFQPGSLINHDISITVRRIDGRWQPVVFVGMPLPNDVHQAQRAITDDYRVHRIRIARGFKQSKQKFKNIKSEAEVAQREAKAASTLEGS